MLLTMHHIVSDSWSVGVLLNEIYTLYAAFLSGKLSPLLEPVHEGEQLSYAELNGRRQPASALLRRSGVGVETVVGLSLPRASIR